MKIATAAPAPVRVGPTPKKAPVDQGEVESFLGPLAKVLIELATRVAPEHQPPTAGQLAAPAAAEGGQGAASTAAGPALAEALAFPEAGLPRFEPGARGPGAAEDGGTAGSDGSSGSGRRQLAFGHPGLRGAPVESADAREGDALLESASRPALARTADPDASIEVSADPAAPLPEPAALQATSPAAEAALVGLYTSARAASPLHAGLSVSGHAAALGHEPQTAPAEGLPTIHESAVLRTVAAGGEAARVEVQHPELGAIQLDLRLERGSMDLHAVTTSAASAIALRASESALRTSVALAGVELRGMRVDVAQDPDRSQEVRKKKRGEKRPLDTEA